MTLGEAQNGSNEDGVGAQQKPTPSQPFGGLQQATIDNIMSGIENTGAVRMNNHRKKLRQRFDIIKKLGQGTYGKVQLGINKETGQEVAIKTIKKSKIETEADLIRIRREVQIMSSVQHPNIIHIYEVFENREKMVLVMEFAAGGELYDYLSDRKVLTEEEARRIFRQVSTAIFYCHKHKICHRDLKLENILLDEHGNAKIADFGLSNVFDETRLLATFCGSPLYASPEIVKGTPYHGPEVDCWSLGVLLYTLVYGAMPFDGANFKRLVKQISQGDYYEPKSPSRASPLIREMLTVCPLRRANIETICSHWWVNEDYNENCLDLAEDLANQTPVRLDVLLSLAPPSVTQDQVVVPTHEDGQKLQKSHSVGSIIDIAESEAERRILDMVAAGGEAAIMPSSTKIITPSDISAAVAAQTKRKLEPTVSTENASGGAKKKEKQNEVKCDVSKHSIAEVMEIDQEPPQVTAQDKEVPSSSTSTTDKELIPPPAAPVTEKEDNSDVQESLKKIEELCDELMEKTDKKKSETKQKKDNEEKKADQPKPAASSATASTPSPAPTVASATPPKTDTVTKKDAIKKISSPIKRDMVKNKTSDLTTAISSVSSEVPTTSTATVPSSTTSTAVTTSVKTATTPVERKSSLQADESAAAVPSTVVKPTEKRRSRILETAEKFQNMNNQNNEKYKKFSIPGVSVGNFKKEFERKASLTSTEPKKLTEKRGSISSSEQQQQQQPSNDNAAIQQKASSEEKKNGIEKRESSETEINQSDSKSSVKSFTIEDARRSMENSIALLQKARNESQSKEMDQLCTKMSDTIGLSSTSNEMESERERKLRMAREIIGNAIPPSRLIGVRKKPPVYGLHGRSVSGSVVQQPAPRQATPLKSNSMEQQHVGGQHLSHVVPAKVADLPQQPETTKTSHAEITLKSATLPRRKPTKMEIHVDTKPKPENSRYTSDVQHQVPGSAPVREHPPTTYTSFTLQNRSTSLEPQGKEQFAHVQKPPTYQRTSTSSTYRNPLSRQSTNESNDSDTNPSQTSLNQDKQPIKKSPREFIIPISVEGGGVVTPKPQKIETSESSSTTTSRISRPRRINSIFSERDSEDELSSAFPKLHRHTSIGRESDSEEPRFHSMHRLRSSRPTKRSTLFSQDPNDSGSSGEEDDDDGFEILTAENLFSTLLSRVRALTHRLNVNNETTSNFPTSRFMSNLRQSHNSANSPFWNNDPFEASRTNIQHPWRHSMARDIHNDIDSMFSRSGATLPRGKKSSSSAKNDEENSSSETNKNRNDNDKSITTRTGSSSTKTGNIENEKDQTSANNSNNNSHNSHEVLDLRDLDLSQLRLTKKDLETLSSLTPSLSKNIQEQLLAQLPPNQAKKLSRTLSVQNGKKSSASSASTKASAENSTQIYRRSMSTNPRDVATRYSRDSVTPTNDVFDKINNNKNGANSSGTASDNVRHRRSSSRDDSLNNNSNTSRETTPTSLKTTNDYRGPYYSSLKSQRSKNDERKSYLNEDYAQTCFSPEPIEDKPKHKRLSRFLSPDNSSSGDYQLYDEPRKFTPRELETQKILRELCDKSNIDNGRDSREKSVEKESRISYFLEKYASNELSKHLLNGNFANESNQLKKTSSRSDTASSSHSHLSSVSEKILDELNSMSLLNDQLEKFDAKELQCHDKKKKTTVEGTVIRKKKVKEKSPEKTLDESRSEDLSEKSSSRSKIARPKSSIIKDAPLTAIKTTEKFADEKTTTTLTSRYSRPKSFPSTKITPPKEIQFPDSLTNILNTPREPSPSQSKTIPLDSSETMSTSEPSEQPKKTKKIVKVVKKSSKTATTAPSSLDSEPSACDEKREKSPEKKANKGLLYTIGQKFEKLRGSETKSNKDASKKSAETIESSTTTSSSESATIVASTSSDLKEKKKKIKALLSEDVDETTRQERKSKIDAMIKNLREKSLPHNNELTESGLIKRAVSVEEMPNIFNKNAVNKVLGLFKRIEKENATTTTAISTSPQSFEFHSTKVQNTKSSSYLSYCDDDDYDSRASSSSARERPKSSGFVHKLKKNGSAFEPLDNIAESKIPVKYSSTCPDCKESTSSSSISNETVAKRHTSDHQKIAQSLEERERIRNNRKGLMLDLVNDTSVKRSSSKHNYSFPPPLPQDMNQLATPTYDSLTNYSSSPFDCSSTPLSPTDDVGFDRWSTCSEESQLPPHPLGSLSLSRLSRSIHNQSLLDDGEPPESVVDRIRRKSFYSRFNEKKPKRVSTIVGPAAKEYYRERSRPLEYTKSATSIIPDINERCSSERREIPASTSQSSHVRSLSSTRAAAAAAAAAASSSSTTSANHHRSLSQARKYSSTDKQSSDSPLQHSSYMASLPPPYHHHHHHHDLSAEDYSTRIRNNRNTMYDSSSSSSNNTPTALSSLYNRRSYVSTPSSSSATTTVSSSAAMKPPLSFVDGYATIGRKMRQYNTRSVSLLEPSVMSASSNYGNDHHRPNGYCDYNETTRSLRYRHPSVTRNESSSNS